MNRMREQFLLHRIRSHKDMDAYRELYEHYVKRIWRFVKSKVPAPVTEELVADIFASTLAYILDTSVQNLNALLYRVARRRVADYYRSREGGVELEIEHAATIEDTRERADVTAEKSLALERVKRSLATLKPAYREVIEMRYLEGLEIKEIASALSKTTNSTRVLVHRALNALRATLEMDATNESHE